MIRKSKPWVISLAGVAGVFAVASGATPAVAQGDTGKSAYDVLFTPPPAVTNAPAAERDKAVIRIPVTALPPAETNAPPAEAPLPPRPPAAKTGKRDVKFFPPHILMMFDALENVQDEDYAAAIPKLEKVIAEDPAQIAAWESLGWAYWKTGRREDAIRLWERLRELDPSQPRAYNLLAKAAIAENDLPKALELQRKSLELQPDQFNVRYDYSRILRWSGQLDEAALIFTDLLAKDPNRLDVVLELARTYTHSWKYSQALPLWQRLRQAAPGNLEYAANEALCLLHTNQPDAATDAAQKVLDQKGDDLIALEVMASREEFGEHPENAREYLRRMLDAEAAPDEKERVRCRLIRLDVRLNKAQPRVYNLDEAIQLATDRIEYDAASVDAWDLLGELYVADEKFTDAEERFLHVLNEMSAYNLRARKGLFEIYCAVKKFSLAREQLDAIAAFDPADPFLNVYVARLESSRGAWADAYEALDRLEAAGRSGTVAVFLYHGLTESDYFVDALSVRRFRDHLTELKKAGVQFVLSGQIPALLSGELPTGSAGRQTTLKPVLSGSSPHRRVGNDPRPPMLVSINFDDARKDSLQYGTEVSKEFGIRFSHHVPVGYVAINHPFIATWDQLQAYARTGCWEFGSHFVNGAILQPVDASGKLGHALPNRLWLPDRNAMETDEEYQQRLLHEFVDSRRILQERLGQPINFISYPFGDIGQEIETNVEDPVNKILAAGAGAYDVGFIQSDFGYAVLGDNPLLYKRHEMERWQDGQATVEHLYEYHPIFLARRMRAEIAALEGKQYRALRNLRLLEQDGYPQRLLDEATTYVHERLSGTIAKATDVGTIKKGPFDIDNLKPYLGLSGEWFRDNQDRSSWRAFVLGGFNLTPNLTLEGKVGRGALDQDYTETRTQTVGTGRAQRTVNEIVRESLHYDESDVGAKAVYTFPNSAYLAGEAIRRDFTGDHDDYSLLAWNLEGQVRPFLAMDLMLRLEKDLAPAALAVKEEITYTLKQAVSTIRLRDWWHLSLAYSRYDFSDDNNRTHFSIISNWILHERSGFRLGLGYDFTNAEHESNVYWSPYELSRIFLEAGFVGSYLSNYYRLRFRFGMGKEGLRPEEVLRYQETAARAKREKWDPGPPPEEGGWEPIFGLAASTRIKWGRHWVLNGEISYNKNPNYNELWLLGGIRYNF